MVRKRARYTRQIAKHSRPKTPAPSSGWVLAELAQLSGLSATTVRYYVQQRLIRSQGFRGTITRYARRELLRLLAIRRIKSEGKTTLAQIKRLLDAHTEASLEVWVSERPLSPEAARALGIALPTNASSVNGAAARQSFDPALGSGWVETWQRITLLPGLDLMLRLDAPDSVRVAAQRISQEYGR